VPSQILSAVLHYCFHGNRDKFWNAKTSNHKLTEVLYLSL